MRQSRYCARRRWGRWCLLVAGLLILGLLAQQGWQRNWFGVRQSEAAATDNDLAPSQSAKGPEIDRLRQAYSDAFREVGRFSLLALGTSLVCMVVIAFVLIYRSSDIPAAKPFDPEKDRKRPKPKPTNHSSGG